MPFDLFDRVLSEILPQCIIVCTKVVPQEVFVPFRAGHQGIAAPDKPDSRPVFLGIRVFD